MNHLRLYGSTLNEAALLCAGKSSEDSKTYSSHDAMDGMVTLDLNETNQNNCQPMTAEAKECYSLGSLTPTELDSIHSFEIPIKTYLSTLITVLDEHQHAETIGHLKNLITKIEVSENTVAAKNLQNQYKQELSDRQQQTTPSSDVPNMKGYLK